MKKILFIFSLLSSLFTIAQQHYILKIEPVIDGSYHDLENEAATILGKKIKLNHFDYYFSKLTITHDGGQVLDLSDSVYLIEPTNFLLDLGMLNVNQVESIHFGVGVPFELSHTDISTYPSHHPLSFQSPSMYWGWSAGYMHMIIGGLVDGDNDDVPEQSFELHNIGDQNFHEVDLPVYEYTEAGGNHIITVSCNIDTWINTLDLAAVDSKHGSDGANETIMSHVVNYNVFTSKQAYLGVKNESIGNLNYSVSPSLIVVSAKDISNPERYEFVNANGQILKQGSLNSPDFTLEFANLSKGIYFLNVFSKKERLHQLKMIY